MITFRDKLSAVVFGTALIIAIIVGCAPVPSENDSQVSGNLKNVQLVHRGCDYVTAIVIFENKEVHVFLLYNTEHYNFQLDRINVIHYDSMNHITKVEILE
jgi:hypothetical protein